MLLKRQLSFFSLSSTSALEGVGYTRVDSPVNYSPSDSLYSASGSVQLLGDYYYTPPPSPLTSFDIPFRIL